MSDTQMGRWNFQSGQLPYRDQLFRTAVRLTGSADDAEDLLQETYLKAYRRYELFEEGTNLRAWLFRIMKNAFINAYRRDQKRGPNVALDDLGDGVERARVDEASRRREDPERELVMGEMDAGVRSALEGLPHKYKMVVVLADIQGYAYKEVAEILEIPVGTVMSRLYRGRKRLERALLQYGVRENYIKGTPDNLRDSGIDAVAVLNGQ